MPSGRRSRSTRAATRSQCGIRTTATASASGPATTDSLVRLENDGVTSISQSSADPSTQVLLSLIGAHRVAAFSFETGTSVQLTSIDRLTTGYDFDGDQREDLLQYRIDQTPRGMETITAFGAPRQALRIDHRTELTIVMSGGGRSIDVVETRSRWTLPFAGPVREESSATATDSAGRTTTLSSQRTAERAVVNAVSWPGGVHVDATPLREPTGYMFTTPLGVTEDLRVSFGGFVPGPCCQLPDGLSSRDLSGSGADVDIVVPARR